MSGLDIGELLIAMQTKSKDKISYIFKKNYIKTKDEREKIEDIVDNVATGKISLIQAKIQIEKFLKFMRG